MPYKVKGKCVYKKDTGKKVGCTKGSVKKYLAALHMHADESLDRELTKEELEEIIQEEYQKLLNEDVAPDPRYQPPPKWPWWIDRPFEPKPKPPKPKPPKPKYGPCIPPKCWPGPPGKVGHEKLKDGTWRKMKPGTWDTREISSERRTKGGPTHEQVPKNLHLDEIIQEAFTDLNLDI